jgi:hypothetical protein
VRPWIASARVVAGLDVGWLGVAAPNAAIVDLAGVTDPSIARLPGGHTTKRLPEGLLDDRSVDAVVLLASPGDTTGAGRTAASWQRGVEAVLARNEAFCADFEPVLRAEGRLPYVVFRRRHSFASEGAASEAEPPDRSSIK